MGLICLHIASNGCGLDIAIKDGHIVGVRDRDEDRSIIAGSFPKDFIAGRPNSQDRLIKPLLRKEGKLLATTWEEAMNLIVAKSKEIIAKQTGVGIGFYTSGWVLLARRA